MIASKAPQLGSLRARGQNGRKLLSINQLSDLTGRDRRTITKQLENLEFIAGEKSAHLYESSQALPRIYAIESLDAARAKLAIGQASLNADSRLVRPSSVMVFGDSVTRCNRVR